MNGQRIPTAFSDFPLVHYPKEAVIDKNPKEIDFYVLI